MLFSTGFSFCFPWGSAFPESRSLRFPVSATGNAGISVKVSFLLSTTFSFSRLILLCSHQGTYLFLVLWVSLTMYLLSRHKVTVTFCKLLLIRKWPRNLPERSSNMDTLCTGWYLIPWFRNSKTLCLHSTRALPWCSHAIQNVAWRDVGMGQNMQLRCSFCWEITLQWRQSHG